LYKNKNQGKDLGSFTAEYCLNIVYNPPTTHTRKKERKKRGMIQSKTTFQLPHGKVRNPNIKIYMSPYHQAIMMMNIISWSIILGIRVLKCRKELLQTTPAKKEA
jgi:hypothetical protein